jgi:AcrR family transcriptional regulator
MKLPKPATAQAEKGERPRRGTPGQTRARIVMAAARAFQDEGYFGTDSNVIARAAGYAPGTFYKHFVDKREAFLAVYADWVTAQWAEIAKLLESEAGEAKLAPQLIDQLLEHHRQWRVFRGSLKALIATDAEVRKAHRTWRRRQLKLLSDLLGYELSSKDALELLLGEHIADALADGDSEALGVPRELARKNLAATWTGLLSRRKPKSRRARA